jgi:hypothetical protein
MSGSKGRLVSEIEQRDFLAQQQRAADIGGGNGRDRHGAASLGRFGQGALLADRSSIDQHNQGIPFLLGNAAKSQSSTERIMLSSGRGELQFCTELGGNMKILKFLVLVLVLPSMAMATLTNAERKSQFERAMAAIIAATTPALSAPPRYAGQGLRRL